MGRQAHAEKQRCSHCCGVDPGLRALKKQRAQGQPSKKPLREGGRPCQKNIYPFCRGPTCGKCVRKQWRSLNNASFALIRREWGQHWPRWNERRRLWILAAHRICLVVFQKNQVLNHFFVFYWDTKLLLTPRTHPHKNLVF